MRDGCIRTVRGSVSGHAPGSVPAPGVLVAADAVMLAINWPQRLLSLHAATRAKLIEPDGRPRLHRLMVNLDLPGLGFAGFNSSLAQARSSGGSHKR